MRVRVRYFIIHFITKSNEIEIDENGTQPGYEIGLKLVNNHLMSIYEVRAHHPDLYKLIYDATPENIHHSTLKEAKAQVILV